MNPSTIKVALLSGGSSDEREISLASGKGAQSALLEAGFQVEMLDPANTTDLKRLIDESYDVAFICLHGQNGEDGTLQGFLELIGLPYTGSNVFSSALAMNKAHSKVFYEKAGIPTPHSITLKRGLSFDIDEVLDEIGEYCVVKAASEGSAIGVYIVNGKEEAEKAIEQVFLLDEEALVEQFIKGMELTVAVLGNDDPYALPIIQIIPQSDFYDFESKYTPGGSKHICPAPISDELSEEIKNSAVQTHKALTCSGVSRTDFILEDDGSYWALETNTIPGMTQTSLLPDAARAAGISFAELCTKLIEYALERKN